MACVRILLTEAATGRRVGAWLHDHVDPEHLSFCRGEWSSRFAGLQERLGRGEEPGPPVVPDARWDWGWKVEEYGRMRGLSAYCITVGESVEAIMLLGDCAQSRLVAKGALREIEYLATAPWNRCLEGGEMNWASSIRAVIPFGTGACIISNFRRSRQLVSCVTGKRGGDPTMEIPVPGVGLSGQGRTGSVAMKAIVIPEAGSPEVLRLEDRASPVPTDSEVLIRVEAAGVNRADVMQRLGKYPAPEGVPADIPGLEVSGRIEACGRQVERWKPGDAVSALLGGGGYAERVVVEAAHCLPVPEGVSLVEAAALPEAVFTVWHNVFQRGGLKAAERLLVHGGSSGIGQTAIQLANALGAVVCATAGTDAKCEACLRAGAKQAVPYREADFEEVLKEAGFDVILDMVGGDYVPKNLRLLRPEGRLVQIAVMGGRRAELDLLTVMSRRLTVTGSTLRGRKSAFKAALAREVEARVWPLIREGRFFPIIDRVFPAEEAADAHRLMEEGSHIGKILIHFGET